MFLAFLGKCQWAALGGVSLKEITLSPARSQSGRVHCQPQQYMLKMGGGSIILPSAGPVPSRRSGPAGVPDKHLP